MVKQRDIYITAYDLRRLSELLSVGLNFHGKNGRHVAVLQEELDRAHVVEPDAVPHDVVTMNSRVRLTELETGKERTIELVFPSEAEITQNKISVLAPIGTALLGYRVGDTIAWTVPAGMKTVRIEEILYQPETAGDYHL
jgi:regulator of nucleoside diphosphate kinase